MINNALVFLKKPVSFNGLFNLYPPSVDEVIGNSKYPLYLKILTTSQEEIEDFYIEKNINAERIPTPLEYLMAMSYNDDTKQMEQETIDAFYYFTHEKITMIYKEKMILIGNPAEVLSKAHSIKDLNFITENNFFDFQNKVREVCGIEPIEAPNPDEDPRVKRIKAKARYRDKIKAKKGLALKNGSMLAAICCMGFGLNPLNIGEISYASALTLMRYYQEKEKYDTDIRSIQAGADSKKVKAKYWIRNIDD